MPICQLKLCDWTPPLKVLSCHTFVTNLFPYHTKSRGQETVQVVWLLTDMQIWAQYNNHKINAVRTDLQILCLAADLAV